MVRFSITTLLNHPTQQHVDVNECAFENGGCHHECVNFGGSYSCRCHDGYVLQADELNCRGKAKLSSLVLCKLF